MTVQLRPCGIAAPLLGVMSLLCVCAFSAPAVRALPVCPGDLNGDGETTVDEIVAAVNAALNGCATTTACPGDQNGDGETTVDEIVAGVNAALNGCGGAGPTPTPGETATRKPAVSPTPTVMLDVTPISAAAAVTKVKNLLVGLPPTDAEVEAVAMDRSALPDLVGQWMSLPEYNEKMLRFFVSAFQQDQWEHADIQFQYRGNLPFSHNSAQIVENFQQSFARTVMQLIAEGQPFTSAMTTTRFMMTPALMAAYAMLDDIHIDNNYNFTDFFPQEHPVRITIESSNPIPPEQALDPASPNFLTFYDPAIAVPYAPGCAYGTIDYPPPAPGIALSKILFDYQPWFMTFGCLPQSVPPDDRYITDADFTTWQMVTIRQPHAGEETTQMYELQAMRAGHDLVMRKPRVSFFTTPAFGARWPTNDDNQSRVLINQTLIVALGQAIDLTNTTAPPSLAALNEEHAAPGTTCYACHQALDPMRQFFRQTYTYYLSEQDDPTLRAMNGQFAFHGVSAEGSHIGDLGALLAAHPMLPTAWVQKLCTYATSQLCDEHDPEFVRLVGVFTGSNYSWNELVQALFSSPLVTYLEATQTARRAGQTFPIARQAHLCATLSNRLGISDVCGLDANSPMTHRVTQIVAASWPSDQYSRGNQTPALAISPSLMMRGGLKSVCGELAEELVDGSNAMFPISEDPTAAIQNLVTRLMGLTSERAAGPRGILEDHFRAARQMGVPPRDALRSTFVLACLSPYVAGVGQ